MTPKSKSKTPAPAPAPTPAAPAATAAQPAPLPPAPEGFVNVFVDGNLLHVKKGSTVMQACVQAEKEIPHFCFHKRLAIAGNCRMCLVEIEGMPKPVASCHWPVAEGMKVRTDSPVAVEARKGTMELLLANHPLDCPICDQGGECKLQDEAIAYGSDRGHFHEDKRALDDKDIGAKIKTVMTRCIACTRCVRFATDIAGVEEFGATFRGENTQIGTYVEQALQSELAGNMIDLCPVGALTSKPYAYRARPWELVRTPGVDVLDCVGGAIEIDTRAGKVMRTLPREDDTLNEEWMTDAARFSTDALHTNRVTTPLVNGKAVGWGEALAAVKKAVAEATAEGDGKAVGGVLGNMASMEEAVAFKMFMTQTLGSGNVDSRPAGSILGTVAAPLLGTSLMRVDCLNAVLMVGCNPRLEAPLVNLRVRRAVTKGKAVVGRIGLPEDLTYPVTELGETPDVLDKLLGGKAAFAKTLKEAGHSAIWVSATVLTRPDAAAIWARCEALATKTGSALGVLADTCGRIGAVQAGVLPTAKGKDTAAMLRALKRGTLKLLFVAGDDTVQADALEGEGTVIYAGTHLTDVAQKAAIVLPVAVWTEQGGSYMNASGRVQTMAAATLPPHNAKEGWKIWRALSEELGAALPFDTFAQVEALAAAAKPVEPEAAADAGEVSEAPLGAPVAAHYLKHTYLAQSPTMAVCQGEVGTAMIGKGV